MPSLTRATYMHLSVSIRSRNMAVEDSCAKTLVFEYRYHDSIRRICGEREKFFCVTQKLGARYWVLRLSLEQTLHAYKLKWMGHCFAHGRRRAVSLYAVLRGKFWLDDGSGWPVGDIAKSMRTSTTKMACVGAIRLPSWDRHNPSSSGGQR